MTWYVEKMNKNKRRPHEGFLKNGEERKHPKSNLLGRKLEVQRQPKKCTGEIIASENNRKKQEFEKCRFDGRRNGGVTRLFGQDRTFQVSEHVWCPDDAASQTDPSMVNSW